MQNNKDKKWDVCVIGGGPAGMMAAGRAGESKKVILLEKNKKLGQKLLLTGKGRCNITTAEIDDHEFVKKLNEKGDFLYSGLSDFGVEKTTNFFKEKLNLPLKEERGGRVFPESGKAEDVLRALKKYLKKNNVEIKRKAEVKEFKIKDKKVISVALENSEVKAEKFIIATGGKSYPETGSSGDGFKWAEKAGHKITDIFPSLVPLKTKEKWVKKLQGLDLKNVKLKVYQEGNEKEERFGDMIFTHFGVSGPAVLDLSRKVVKLLKSGEVKMKIDLKPALGTERLDKRLRRDFKKHSGKMIKNGLKDLLPSKLISVFLKLAEIHPSRITGSITKKEKGEILKTLKGIELTIVEPSGFEQAVVTKGGVSTDEVEQQTMKSKLIKNLYFAGEVLNLDGPTGGYNLQIAWTTGFIAGRSTSLN